VGRAGDVLQARLLPALAIFVVAAVPAVARAATAGKTIHMAAGAKSAAVVVTLPNGRKTIAIHAVITPAQSLGVKARLESGKSLYYSPTNGGTCVSAGGKLTCDYSIPVKTSGKYVITFGRFAGPALDIALTIKA
jgi:hypothetical protein